MMEMYNEVTYTQSHLCEFLTANWSERQTGVSQYKTLSFSYSFKFQIASRRRGDAGSSANVNL